MVIKKIVAKNFMVPGIQTYEFDNLGGLVNGGYCSINELPILEELFNGSWQNLSDSFESFYPKFAYETGDMNLDVDAMVIFTNDELEQFNKILKAEGFNPQKSLIWFYTIRCVYPYIFPIVNFRSCDDPKGNNFLLGNHYDKFMKSNLSKRELISAAAINAVGKFRKEYFKYKKTTVTPENKNEHDEYLGLLRSIFRYDSEFIKKISKTTYQIDDGDILRYGDQIEFYMENKLINDWFDSIDILKTNPKIRLDFTKLLFELFYRELQWAYLVRSSNNVLEIRSLLSDNHFATNLDYRKISNFMNFTIEQEPLEFFEEHGEGNFTVDITHDEVEPYLEENVLEEELSDFNELISQFKMLQKCQETIYDEVEKSANSELLDAAEKKRLAIEKAKEDKMAKKLAKTNKKIVESPEIVPDELEKFPLLDKIEVKKRKKLIKQAEKNKKIVIVEDIVGEMQKWN